jgi:hypothetical protein
MEPKTPDSASFHARCMAATGADRVKLGGAGAEGTPATISSQDRPTSYSVTAKKRRSPPSGAGPSPASPV